MSNRAAGFWNGGLKLAGVALCALVWQDQPAARAGVTPPDYGLNWVTIGDPGNRGVLPAEVPDRPELANQNLGAVSYEFRLTQTEITVSQWFEFVLAYQPHYQGPSNDPGYIGFDIRRSGNTYAISGDPTAPTSMSWEFAARYCNWLHNGKALTRDAFESGAYDTSTFTRNPDGTANHQLTRSEGALFWIPSLDEWTKGAHWDPAKNNGDGGYWRYPGASDEQLIPGPPGSGGQTNGGDPPGPATAGSYPDVNGPWGLLDTSGGVREWTETQLLFATGVRRTRGSSRGSPFFADNDRLDAQDFAGGLSNPSAGLRLASRVPSPGAFALSGPVLVLTLLRRQRCVSEESSSRSWGLCAAPQDRSQA